MFLQSIDIKYQPYFATTLAVQHLQHTATQTFACKPKTICQPNSQSKPLETALHPAGLLSLIYGQQIYPVACQALILETAFITVMLHRLAGVMQC